MISSIDSKLSIFRPDFLFDLPNQIAFFLNHPDFWFVHRESSKSVNWSVMIYEFSPSQFNDSWFIHLDSFLIAIGQPRFNTAARFLSDSFLQRDWSTTFEFLIAWIQFRNHRWQIILIQIPLHQKKKKKKKKKKKNLKVIINYYQLKWWRWSLCVCSYSMISVCMMRKKMSEWGI